MWTFFFWGGGLGYSTVSWQQTIIDVDLCDVPNNQNEFLDTDEPVPLSLPNQWLWDIIDEFIYQVSVSCKLNGSYFAYIATYVQSAHVEHDPIAIKLVFNNCVPDASPSNSEFFQSPPVKNFVL